MRLLKSVFGRSVAAVLAVASTVACQTGGGTAPALSLEEAKKVTTEFSGAFTPPPRSVNDLLAGFRDVDLSGRNCAYSVPTSDEDVQAMMETLPPPVSGNAGRVGYLENLAGREFEIGNHPRAVKFMRMAVNAVPDQIRGMRVVMAARLATLQAYAGDFEAADDAISEAEGIAAGISWSRWGGDENSIHSFNYFLNEAKAAVAQSEGQLVEAEAYYRRSLDAVAKVRRASFFTRGEFTKIALAENLARQGRLLEAENMLRDILRPRLSYTPLTQIVAKGVARLSTVLYEQGRYAEAESLAGITVRLYETMCAAPESLSLALARDVLGKAMVAQARWTDAIEVYEAARAAMAKDEASFKRLFAGNLYRSLALLRAGRTAAAAAGLRTALERSRRRLGDNHYKTAEIRGFMAMARVAEGDREGALADFAAATGNLLARSREADDEESSYTARDKRLAIILGAYVGLLADIRGTALAGRAGGLDIAEETFRLAEVARSRAVQRALTASGARAALTDPALAELARREQDTQKQITALYGTLARELSMLERNRSMPRIKSVKAAIERLRGARTALLKEIETRFPSYAQLIDPQPLTAAQARSALLPGEALISTYVGDDRTFVWVIPKQGEVAFSAVDIGREELTDVVAGLRAALEPNARALGDIPPFDVVAAYDLYDKLLAPVRPSWQDAVTLLVVAHGPLGYLPMSVLPTKSVALGKEREPLFANYRDVPWLARSHAVAVLPSVASLRTLRDLPPGNPKRKAFAGFGDPWFSSDQAAAAAGQQQQVAQLQARGLLKTRGLLVTLRAAPKTQQMDSAELARLPRLPETADEVRSMALAVDADLTKSVFVGKAATEDRIKSMDLSGYKVLAFATHGLVPGDLNGLRQPALAFTSPKVAGGEADGLLTMGEILGLKLDADWVVLSACNTGSGEGTGAEAVSGLGRAFFYAGTRALLVSNWPVETTSAKALTTDLFQRQADEPGLTRAEALRRAMLGLIDGPGRADPESGRTVYSYAHPLFWAPFSLIGDGGGARPNS